MSYQFKGKYLENSSKKDRLHFPIDYYFGVIRQNRKKRLPEWIAPSFFLLPFPRLMVFPPFVLYGDA
jgi:hypothetical protein